MVQLIIKLDPTKKLIVDNLMSNESYNSLVNQQENSEIKDPTGLFTILKNIENKPCSCDYLCIEIGTIYGDFSALAPKKIKVPTKKKEDVQIVIKPVIVVNNTIHKTVINSPPKVPLKSPFLQDKPKPPKIFDDEDCEGDFIKTITKSMDLKMRFMVKIF